MARGAPGPAPTRASTRARGMLEEPRRRFVATPASTLARAERAQQSMVYASRRAGCCVCLLVKLATWGTRLRARVDAALRPRRLLRATSPTTRSTRARGGSRRALLRALELLRRRVVPEPRGGRLSRPRRQPGVRRARCRVPTGRRRRILPSQVRLLSALPAGDRGLRRGAPAAGRGLRRDDADRPRRRGAALALLVAECLPERVATTRHAVVALTVLFPSRSSSTLYFTESLFLLLSVVAFLAAWRGHHVAMLPRGRAPREHASARSADRAAAAARGPRPHSARPRAAAPARRTCAPARAARARAVRGAEPRSAPATGISSRRRRASGATRTRRSSRTSGGTWSRRRRPSRTWRSTTSTTRKVDYATMVAFAVVLVAMWRARWFPRALTLWSTLLWLAPLASKDLDVVRALHERVVSGVHVPGARAAADGARRLGRGLRGGATWSRSPGSSRMRGSGEGRSTRG